MTAPAPVPSTPVPVPTQLLHPWRSTLRTAVAVTIGALSVLGDIAAGLHVDAVPVVVQVLAVASAVTRVLAIPGVHALLQRYAPWLLPAPPA